MPLTKYNNNSLSNLTALPASIPTGKLKFISSQTANNSASISFTSGLTSTYKIYRFVFSNIHPRTDGVQFQFNLSTDSGSNYNVTKTTTLFRAVHGEADYTEFAYSSSYDLAQQTTYAYFGDHNISSTSDKSANGTLKLFNPASTTYVKHFLTEFNNYESGAYSVISYGAGYGNTTSAINAIRFQMSSGNFDGTIAMYGVK